MSKPLSALARFEAGEHAWWETAISDIRPNHIVLRGVPIEELIGNLTYPEMLVFLVTGRRLTKAQSRLLEAVLVAGADHGPRAPSIAAARMAITCGITFNSAVATGLNTLGQYHGGAGEEAMRFFYQWESKAKEMSEQELRNALRDYIDHGGIIPGYGHQLHERDPRTDRLIELAQQAYAGGTIGGQFVRLANLVQDVLQQAKNRPIALNIDGISAAIQCELGLPAEIAQGLFLVSRAIGVVAHVYEQLNEGVRIKGPCPPGEPLVRYVGPSAPRGDEPTSR